GLKIYAETCPQYLLLDDEKLTGNFENTAKFVFSPPVRKKQDNEKLWSALKNGTVLTTGTDHCPFLYEQKLLGKDDFRKIPNGAGGVEHRMSLLYTYGVLQNKISLTDFVKITSVNSSKIFGLYPKKGEIAVGSDADLLIWDDTVEEKISVKTHHQNCDLNIYENFTIKGKPEYVIKRGQIVLSGNKLSENIPYGKFLKRKL
ncbi:MAG: amidohydrolase family protein, partial [Bacteroidales bacterium]|nr:amidohydrolase family protein [Bacteroidales bacterium]